MKINDFGDKPYPICIYYFHKTHHTWNEKLLFSQSKPLSVAKIEIC